jgi:DNA-binding response OmpR family regulator
MGGDIGQEMMEPEGETILLVVKLTANLAMLADTLSRHGYATEHVETLEALDYYLEQGAYPTLAMIDISGFDPSIWARCSRLAQGSTPFLVISPRESPVLRRESLSCGASGVLIKPLGIRNLLESIGLLANGRMPYSGGYRGMNSCPV